LGAVFAVFRASATAAIDDRAEVKNIAAEMFSDFVSCRTQLF
jgi:hypothetical protein